MAQEDNAPLAHLDSEETRLSDESDAISQSGGTAGAANEQKFTLNDYFCTYIDNSAACSVMNTPQPVTRRPTTPKLFAAPSEDEASLGGSLHDLVTSFDSTVKHFTKPTENTGDQESTVVVILHEPSGKRAKHNRTMWWSLTGELPVSASGDETASSLENEAANSTSDPANDASSQALADMSKERRSEQAMEQESEVQFDADWSAVSENESDMQVRGLTQTVDEVINEIECMFDEQGAADENDVNFDTEVDGSEQEAAAVTLWSPEWRCASALHTLSVGALRALRCESETLIGSLNARLVALLAERDELAFQKETFDRFVALLSAVEHERERELESASHRAACAASANASREGAMKRTKRRALSIQGLSSLFTAANWSMLKSPSPSSASGSSACTAHVSMTQSATVATSVLLSPLSASVSVHDSFNLELLGPSPPPPPTEISKYPFTSRHVPIPIPIPIPVDIACRKRPPTVDELRRLNALLAAIKDDSTQVPSLLADYILNVYAPRDLHTEINFNAHNDADIRLHCDNTMKDLNFRSLKSDAVLS